MAEEQFKLEIKNLRAMNAALQLRLSVDEDRKVETCAMSVKMFLCCTDKPAVWFA